MPPSKLGGCLGGRGADRLDLNDERFELGAYRVGEARARRLDEHLRIRGGW